MPRAIEFGLKPLPIMKFPPGTDEVVLRRDLPVPGSFRWTASRKSLFLAAVQNGLLTKDELAREYSVSCAWLAGSSADQTSQPQQPPPQPAKKQEPVPEKIEHGTVIELPNTGTLRVGALCLDLDRRILKINGEVAFTTPRDRYLLQAFMGKSGVVFSHQELLTHLIDQDSASKHTSLESVKVYISELRSKLGPCANYIETVRHAGYVCRDPNF